MMPIVPLIPKSRREFLVAVFLMAVMLLGVLFGLRAYFHGSTRGLPYHDSFAKERAAEWTSFGGAWELHNDAMFNDSDERGAKLITGSHYWHNYSIEADVMLLAKDGDAGLVIRSSDEELGTDAYSGYYVGLRIMDDSLVLGRAGHGWVENSLTLEPGRVQATQWYHLKLLAYNCNIVATTTLLRTGDTNTISVTDDNCLTSGRTGLRSYRSGGIWRNVVIKAATENDLVAMRGNPDFKQSSHRLDDNNFVGFHASSPRGDLYPTNLNSAPHPIISTSIGSLHLNLSPAQTIATIRGSVILTSPELYVQGATGGVAVPRPTVSPSLRIGDQVEVTGRVLASDFSASLENATVQTLWEDAPIPPVTVNALQAATGAYDAMFIEVEGYLTGKHYGQNNTLVLVLESGSQSFRAILSRGRGDFLFAKLKPNSLLRLRGVCVVNPSVTENLTPFVLLPRSSDDIDILRGPPLWSAGHVAIFAAGILCFALIANSLYHRIENWRLRAILEERERVAHEIHDTLAQSFAGIGFQLEAIRTSIPSDLHLPHQQLNLASELVRHSHKEARQSVATLRPEAHESGDLLSLLERSARRMVEGGHVEIVTTSSGIVCPIPLHINDTLYRIGQEAVANSIRHARPTRLSIGLEFCNNMVRLVVSDDGCGFNPGGELGNFGIRGMRKRAASISAELQIKSKPREGSQVQVFAPLPPRITISSFPRHVWMLIKEYARHVRPARQTNSTFHR
jgi:signal transduction histidine kinase